MNKPFKLINKSIWANSSRYYIDNKSKLVGTKKYETANINKIMEVLEQYKDENNDTMFN